jgi:hypothetical protein
MAMFTTFLVGLSLQAVGGDSASIDRCWANESRNGINVRVYKGDRNCVDLAPATEMDGLWLNEFAFPLSHLRVAISGNSNREQILGKRNPTRGLQPNW